MRKGFRILVPFMCLCLMCTPLTGCFGMEQQAAVAALVNGETIEEDDVTQYIEGFRSQNTEYESDEGWAQFLLDNGYTAETMRSFLLDSVFVPQLLIKQECEQRGITLTDSELDAVVEQERAYYEEAYGENTWESVLASYGYDEDSWRENEASRLLEEQLMETVIGDVSPTKRQVQAQADSSAYVYNGKRSWYLLFDSEQEALEACERLQALENKVTRKKIAKAGYSLYYAGWSSLSEDVNAMSTEYVNALNELEAGEVSTAVAQDGQWVVIFCDEVFEVDAEAESVDVDEIPTAIMDQIELDAADAVRADLFEAWMDELTQEADITYYDMPEGLAYDVNVAIVEDEG